MVIAVSEGIVFVIWVVGLVVLALIFVVIWLLGGFEPVEDKVKVIRCRRCDYEGPPNRVYQGSRHVDYSCPDCGSGNWVRIKDEPEEWLDESRPRKKPRRRPDDRGRRRRQRDEENDE